MKYWKPLASGIVAIAVTTTIIVPIAMNRSRSVRRMTAEQVKAVRTPFNPEESAALFAGVRKFTQDQTADVPYAVDDAVDLAYLFALDPGVRLHLVMPQRVVLALAGTPQKEESKRRLQELETAGAEVAHATESDILRLLQQQAAVAGKGGILIVSLATHGYISKGVPYVLGSDSLADPRTTLSTAEICDIAARAEAERSLILIDACRERLSDKTRAGVPDPNTAAPSIALVRKMTYAQGQVVFYAAAAGEYAYDDDVSQNGVFTKAVIDGLHCEASLVRGYVTAATLEAYVERQLRAWIRRNRKPLVGSAIQASMDGAARSMPLACCGGQCPSSQPSVGPIHASRDGSVVTVIAADGTHLWQRDFGAPIVQLDVSDLDGDGSQEVVIGVHGASGQHDHIEILDRKGKLRGRVDDTMTLQVFVTGDLFRKGTRHVVALWIDPHSPASRLSIHGVDGQILSTYEHRGHLQHVTSGRATNRHTPKIVIAGVDEKGAPRVFVFDPKKVSKGKPLWCGTILPPDDTIERLEIVDSHRDAKRAISISTTSGNTLLLDFTGKVIGHRKAHGKTEDAAFVLLPR